MWIIIKYQMVKMPREYIMIGVLMCMLVVKHYDKTQIWEEMRVIRME